MTRTHDRRPPTPRVRAPRLPQAPDRRRRDTIAGRHPGVRHL